MADPLWTARDAAAATAGQLVPEINWTATGVSIDTRTLKPGDLFVALQDQRDGHDFVPDAMARGAAAALVARADCGPGNKLVVGETLEGLRALARYSRDRCRAIRVAVTGSVGKTTVKQALASVFRSVGSAHASQKSYNNHWGVPLTLSLTPADCDRAVYEMGMNHAGEIRELSTLARPHVALITKIAPAHLENLGSMEAIADAKSEIFEGLHADGVAVFPADDDFSARLRQHASHSAAAFMLEFGRAEGAAIRIEDFETGFDGGRGRMSVLGKAVDFRVPAPGAHWAWNAAAIFATAIAAGVDAEATADALAGISAGDGRGATHRIALGSGHFTLIDDSYNANPASMASGLSILGATQPAKGRRIAVLGEMLELGPDSPDMHRALREPLDSASTDAVFLAGEGMRPLADILPSDRLISFEPKADDLKPALASYIAPGDVVFVKGSNASGVHRIARMLAEDELGARGQG
ncbi:UDP-N-acetylmuramoyl-tripeptide--D-alanyl-D-alanine ligase [Hyphobacterium sp.]|jgi:UDP-N-acetylmuramoyl-tripeptide--D-alanyl-D-alanine ligase|uniref:UDP-N-acetylmuramoyl-tripeptide--D-alanyl-D- alanine ligase n=1 Tax=Hyphobacterium sp. TaxID=2004662 RepID=UPI003BABED3F